MGTRSERSQMIGNYQVIKKIGEGGFGAALLAVDIRDKSIPPKHVVVKRIDLKGMRAKTVEYSINEARLLADLSAHPFVVRYHEAFVVDAVLFVVMDFCEKGDLHNLLRRKLARNEQLTEPQVLKYFCQICAAVHFLHQRNIMHRDLKLQNILLDGQSRVQVSDFGVSKQLSDTDDKAMTQIGTVLFMPPEMFQGQPYSFKADIWSLGCILFEMIQGDIPFGGASLPAVRKAVLTQKTPRLSSRISEKTQRLCYQMLDKDPAKRPDIANIIAHESIQGALSKLQQDISGKK